MKHIVRFCREETWFVDITVDAGSREEAEELAEAKREETASDLEWAVCDGNEYEPYISNVLDSDDPTLYCTHCGAKTKKDCKCGPIPRND